MSTTVCLVLACVCAVIAAGFDLYCRRIPNWLTASTLICGIVIHLTISGWSGVLIAGAGGMIAGLIFFIFFLLGGMGAGDVKLITALGVVIGINYTPPLLLFTALAGGVSAVLMIAAQGRGMESVRNLGRLFYHFLANGPREHPELNLQSNTSLKMPYAVPIAVGTFLTFYLHKVGK